MATVKFTKRAFKGNLYMGKTIGSHNDVWHIDIYEMRDGHELAFAQVEVKPKAFARALGNSHVPCKVEVWERKRRTR